MKYTIFSGHIRPFFLLLTALLWFAANVQAQNINPVFFITNEDGEEEECTTYSGSAPIKARFVSNAEGFPANATFEWQFFLDADTTAYLIRYEEGTDVTFTKAGQHRVLLYVRYNDNGTDLEFGHEDSPLTISVAESQLVFPNAFSPNGDGINDIYKAKQGWQSIVEFQATIVNRWGQVLYQWNSPEGGWDGTYKGKPVKDGVYFCYVKAKGADGRVYTIRKDVNLLRGFTEKAVNN